VKSYQSSLAERSGGAGATHADCFALVVESLSPVVYQGLGHAQQLPLGWFLHPAGPDIHLPSKTPESPNRRLSLCPLPVPKQSDESLRSLISFAQSPNGVPQTPPSRRWLRSKRGNAMIYS
jgi:hypothetical protein